MQSKLEKTEEYKTNSEVCHEDCNNGYCKINNDEKKDQIKKSSLFTFYLVF